MEEVKKALARIEAKLDKVIKAMQEYDGVDEEFNPITDGYEEYRVFPCVGHAIESDKEEEKIVKQNKKKNETLQSSSTKRNKRKYRKRGVGGQNGDPRP